jgi:hypothetical protein
MKLRLLLALFVLAAARVPAVVIDVAIVEGSYYTPNLANRLSAFGVNVTLISSYTAESLSGYDAVIHYGNSYFNSSALQTYVSGGGRLIETPWFWNNNSVTSGDLGLLTGSENDQYSGTYPGVTINAPGDSLLNNVTFPGAGGFSIGREDLRSFSAGVTNVATWGDNGSAFLGYRTLGDGKIFAINMHLITSDTAYSVIDQNWALQIVMNAIGAPVTVPEPSTWALLSGGLVGVALLRRRRVRR